MIERIIDCLFENQCIFCKCRIGSGDTICKRCNEETLHKYMISKHYNIDGCDGFTSPFYYKGEVRRAFIDYKFNGRKHYYRFFAHYMAEKLLKSGWSIDLITYVPLGYLRYHKRGYNQSKLFARYIAQKTDISVRPLLFKNMFQKRQSKKNADQRMQNVLKAFSVRNSGYIANKNILIVDDVCTTGATLSVCAQLLKKSGAQNVYAITAVKTPSILLEGDKNA